MAPRPADRDPVERITLAAVAIVLVAVPALVFFFSFGNVGLLGTSLGVEHWIAFLTGPAVDLSVAGCVLASSYLATRGRSDADLRRLHIAGIVCGLVMVGLNTGGAIYIRHWRLAAFDSVGPMLLIGWGFLAPWLWRNMIEAKNGHSVQRTQDRSPSKVPKNGATDQGAVQKTGQAAATLNGQTVHADRPATVQTPEPSTVHAGAGPSGPASTDDQEELVIEIGQAVYVKLKDDLGKRPPEEPYRAALAAACAPLVAAGRLPVKPYGDPSTSTAKRVRKDVETRFPELSPLHLIREAS